MHDLWWVLIVAVAAQLLIAAGQLAVVIHMSDRILSKYWLGRRTIMRDLLDRAQNENGEKPAPDPWVI